MTNRNRRVMKEIQDCQKDAYVSQIHIEVRRSIEFLQPPPHASRLDEALLFLHFERLWAKTCRSYAEGSQVPAIVHMKVARLRVRPFTVLLNCNSFSPKQLMNFMIRICLSVYRGTCQVPL